MSCCSRGGRQMDQSLRRNGSARVACTRSDRHGQMVVMKG